MILTSCNGKQRLGLYKGRCKRVGEHASYLSWRPRILLSSDRAERTILDCYATANLSSIVVVFGASSCPLWGTCSVVVLSRQTNGEFDVVPFDVPREGHLRGIAFDSPLPAGEPSVCGWWNTKDVGGNDRNDMLLWDSDTGGRSKQRRIGEGGGLQQDWIVSMQTVDEEMLCVAISGGGSDAKGDVSAMRLSGMEGRLIHRRLLVSEPVRFTCTCPCSTRGLLAAGWKDGCLLLFVMHDMQAAGESWLSPAPMMAVSRRLGDSSVSMSRCGEGVIVGVSHTAAERDEAFVVQPEAGYIPAKVFSAPSNRTPASPVHASRMGGCIAVASPGRPVCILKRK